MAKRKSEFESDLLASYEFRIGDAGDLVAVFKTHTGHPTAPFTYKELDKHVTELGKDNVWADVSAPALSAMKKLYETLEKNGIDLPNVPKELQSQTKMRIKAYFKKPEIV